MIIKGKAETAGLLARPPVHLRAALFHGRDAGLVRDRAQRLAGRVTERPDDPFDVGLMVQSDIDDQPQRLEEELAAISMLGGRRLVWLRLSDDKGYAAKRTVEALASHVAGEFNPDAFFLIEAPALSKDAPLRKSAEREPSVAVVACYDDEPADLKELARHALSKESLGLTNEALDLFVGRLPPDRGVAKAEIERLILFLGPHAGRSTDVPELQDFLGVEAEASLGRAADDAFGGRLAEAQAALAGAGLPSGSAPAAVRAMGYHLGRLRRVLTAHESGAELKSAARAAGVFWKEEREFLRQARAWTLHHLDSLQSEVLAADQSCKHTGAPAELLAERLALSIAMRAQRLGL